MKVLLMFNNNNKWMKTVHLENKTLHQHTVKQAHNDQENNVNQTKNILNKKDDLNMKRKITV